MSRGALSDGGGETAAAPIEVRVQQLDEELPLPVAARPGDAGMDLRARVAVSLPAGGGRALVPTGLAVELPEGTAGLVLPRSGLALRDGVTCLNAPGLIDSGYRAEVSVILVNTDPVSAFEVRRGDRIAQLVIVDVRAVRLVPTGELSASERGGGGFGHTGRT
ncbi:MAG: dUTP diphosphatase [Acidimicrobiales bacterium]